MRGPVAALKSGPRNDGDEYLTARLRGGLKSPGLLRAEGPFVGRRSDLRENNRRLRFRLSTRVAYVNSCDLRPPIRLFDSSTFESRLLTNDNGSIKMIVEKEGRLP